MQIIPIIKYLPPNSMGTGTLHTEGKTAPCLNIVSRFGNTRGISPIRLTPSWRANKNLPLQTQIREIPFIDSVNNHRIIFQLTPPPHPPQGAIAWVNVNTHTDMRGLV